MGSSRGSCITRLYVALSAQAEVSKDLPVDAMRPTPLTHCPCTSSTSIVTLEGELVPRKLVDRWLTDFS